tara:strand:+ start:140 stop:499 length:360 start_codon:yes stop_codon:yes gene_type:complete
MSGLENLDNEENQPQNIGNLDDIESCLIFFVDKDGEVGYNADWRGGIEGFANMLFSMAYGSLLDEILNDMEQECVKSGNTDEFQEILSVMTKRLREKNAQAGGTGDTIVIPPLSDLYYK